MREERSNVHLRPRFRDELSIPPEELLAKFEKAISHDSFKFKGTIIGNHVILDISSTENHFWSPQLNITIEKGQEKASLLRGLFGPKPQIWTFFMFIHFAVALAFVGFGIMAYVKMNLGKSYLIPLVLCSAMPVIWLVLYAIGQLGRQKGRAQMIALNNFMNDVIVGEENRK
ncbi:MAG: GTP-binding protein [Flavobacteriaceae bacterium]|nr:MAG: GTP-binding protein [Flavobacteriaceae bacterium]